MKITIIACLLTKWNMDINTGHKYVKIKLQFTIIKLQKNVFVHLMKVQLKSINLSRCKLR